MGSGFALDSFKSMQYTRALKQMSRVRYNEMKEAVSKIKAKYHTFHDRSQLSDDELTIYKKKIKRKIKRDRQKAFLISGFLTLIVIGLIYFAAHFLIDYFLKS